MFASCMALLRLARKYEGSLGNVRDLSYRETLYYYEALRDELVAENKQAREIKNRR